MKAAVVYFVIVFGAGSVLGVIRTLVVVPRLGERMAELIELPVMLMVIILAAKFIIDRFHLPPSLRYRLGAGVLAFAFGLVFEFGVVLKLRGLTLAEYFQTRDPIALAVYYLALVLLTLMPVLLDDTWPLPLNTPTGQHHIESNSSHGFWIEDIPREIES